MGIPLCPDDVRLQRDLQDAQRFLRLACAIMIRRGADDEVRELFEKLEAELTRLGEDR